jgi:hypothetical protein
MTLIMSFIFFMVLVYDGLIFQQYFRYIVDVSFISGGNRSRKLEEGIKKRQDL